MRFRNIFLSAAFLALVGFLFVPVAQAFAVQYGAVIGQVTHNSISIPGANVSVLCNGNTLTTTTNPTGLYFVQFTNSVCMSGQTVTVTATSGGMSGTETGTMDNGNSYGGVRVDVAVVNIPLVPEFGMITGAVTALTSGGLFLLKRRA